MTDPVMIIDAHQDIAYNIQTLGRDYFQPLKAIRANDPPELSAKHGTALLSVEEYRKANIGIIFGTLFASPKTDILQSDPQFHYSDPSEAFKLYADQIDIYERCFNHPSKAFAPLRDQTDLLKALKTTTFGTCDPIHIMISMEGADCVRDAKDLKYFWDRGVRAIGPAWQRTRHCVGTDQPCGLTMEGRELLKNMEEMGFILDLSHMDWLAIHQAFDMFGGTIIASHANILECVPNATRNRFLPDNIVKKLIARGGVIGVIPYNNFLFQYWSLTENKPLITLDHVIEHIDHICQLAGSSEHAALGSDFDGGFGAELTPDGIDSIADLTKIGDKLTQRGYNGSDVKNILSGNWIRILRGSLP